MLSNTNIHQHEILFTVNKDKHNKWVVQPVALEQKLPEEIREYERIRVFCPETGVFFQVLPARLYTRYIDARRAVRDLNRNAAKQDALVSETFDTTLKTVMLKNKLNQLSADSLRELVVDLYLIHDIDYNTLASATKYSKEKQDISALLNLIIK
jgi:hypothetical protein